jgi:predicted O-methyltransferase YrrM
MDIPYKLIAAVPPQDRWMQMYHAIQQGYPTLADHAIDDAKRLQLVCYGPSLRETWKDIDPTLPIMTVSGALKFLAERGITPTWHVQMDPRREQPRFVDPPVPGVHYLMASVCPPETWKVLQGQQVTLWHANSGEGTLEFLARHAPAKVEGDQAHATMISGGSHVGLCALHVAGKLGFRHFEIFGMDGSFAADGARHAGDHPGHTQKPDTFWDVFNVTYRTSKIMANGVTEVLNAFAWFPMFGVFHGAGLQQALIRKKGGENVCCADETEKAERVRASRAVMVNSIWDALRAQRDPSWDHAADLALAASAERVERADYKTGSISKEAMLLIRGLAHDVKPPVAIEVGTFVGNSTMSLAAEAGHVFTCDRSNDCFPASEKVTTYPRRESTEMFADLANKGIRAPLFFFDGRIQEPDIALILRLSAPGAIYLFDDYVGREKGVANVNRLLPFLPKGYQLIGPLNSGTRLALLWHDYLGKAA